MALNWNIIEIAAKQTGQAIRIGVTTDFTRREKSAMSKEARKRNLNITLGDSKRDSSERDDELYVMAKL